MSVRPSRASGFTSRIIGGLLVVSAVSSLAACASSAAGAHGARTTASTPAANTAELASVLTAFDAADSAASSSGDIRALRTSETSAQLQISIAAVRHNRLTGAKQAAFHHVNPVFSANRAGSCFLASATLWTGTAEVGQPDVSEFVRSGGAGGTWRIAANIQISRQAQLGLRSMSSLATPATSSPQSGRLAAVAAQLYERSTGASTDTSEIASSTLLDGQFAAGWRIYRQALAKAGMAVSRTLQSATWSPCATQVDGRTVTFLTVRATDTVRPVNGSTRPVGLPAGSPDLQGLGYRSAVSGSTISIQRVQLYLVALPTAGPGTLLGVSDAPVALSTTPAA